MSDRSEPIVKPIVTSRTPVLPPVVALISSERDMRWVQKFTGLKGNDFRPLFVSRLHADPEETTGFSIAGPVIGAPYAAMLLETLIAWGARKFLYLGWCGSLSEEVKIGDVILPSGAFVDEGTSPHYHTAAGSRTEGAPAVMRAAGDLLTRRKVGFRKGSVWSTDGIYRETPEKVARFRERGAVAVEMELSALFTVGRHHGVDVGALLVVSDELGGSRWRPGFGDSRFNRRRRAVCESLVALCRRI